jgi:regulator of protease activity HflC (stomatin/prohibitin superfamily)
MSKPEGITFDEDKELLESKYHETFHPLAWILSGLCPCTLFTSCFTVTEQEHAIILHFGKYTGRKMDAGCHCAAPCGREIRKVSTRKQTMNLKDIKVVDFNANPLVVSGVVTFFFEQTIKAALDVQEPVNFIATQATAVLKQVVAAYPYESEDGVSLQHEVAQVSEKMVKLLQKQVAVSGARIISFQLNEISYAPEIAQAMLRKQAANALVAARKTIVKGAVDIAHNAVAQLEAQGVKMKDEEKAKIVGNLLIVICSDKDATPTVSLSSN